MLNTSSLNTDCAHVSLNNTDPVPDTDLGIILKILASFQIGLVTNNPFKLLFFTTLLISRRHVVRYTALFK